MKKVTKSTKILSSILLILCIIAIAFCIKNVNKQKSNNSNYNTVLTSETENSNEKAQTNSTSQTTKTETTSSVESNQEDFSNELFAKYYEQAEEIMKDMTIEEKVGQMFLVRYPDNWVIEQIKEETPGGYILFGKDFDNETKESILKELTENQQASKIGLIFGVDEEGGTVVRVSSHKAFRSSKFQSPQELWKQGQLPKILEDSKEKSELLKSIGLNMNLAPVVDVPTKTTSFIYKRSYGRGAEKTATYVSRLIQTMNEDNMISVMKHFPGYGDNVDTHTGIAIDERPYSTFETSDFLPFESGIKAEGPCILVSHNIVKSMDESYPASLSENVHKILREELKFSGVVITDDLAMDAVKTYAENGAVAVQAVLAGNDMLITTDYEQAYNDIKNAINEGTITQENIDHSVFRIIAWKYYKGLL